APGVKRMGESFAGVTSQRQLDDNPDLPTESYAIASARYAVSKEINDLYGWVRAPSDIEVPYEFPRERRVMEAWVREPQRQEQQVSEPLIQEQLQTQQKPKTKWRSLVGESMRRSRDKLRDKVVFARKK